MRRLVLALAVCSGLVAGSAVAEDGLKLSVKLSNVPAASSATTTPAPPAVPVPLAAAASEAIPASAPRSAAPVETPRQYRIGEEDLLEIKVFGVDQLSSTVRVDPRGQVTLPLLGPVTVAGLTAQGAEALIAALLRENYLQNPQVSLFIKEYTTQRVTVEGAVNRPGVYPLRGASTLLTSLALAGGPARMSETTQVMLFRPDGAGRRVATVHNLDLIRTGQIDDPAVLNDDLIVVNRTASRVVLRDSLFGDMLDVLNPFRYIPAP
jgi:polysaccharide export outer membrane protein